MILTISMIVKNEEKYLEQCLTAIKPILDNVDSELIITDTGSVDRTVEIAKKFTDKVLYFEWINDFAAARNVGLKEAQGEWFMFLDADEIFVSCEGIIEFFNSGKYKQYNSASFIMNNIFEKSGYSCINKAPRLTRILKNTVFRNKVHEELSTYGSPKKELTDMALHYGYLYENEEQRKAKKERNQKLLLERFGKEKDTNPHIYVQMFDNEVGDDQDRAMKYADDGIELSKKLGDMSIIPLMMYKAAIYYNQKEYELCTDICREYFSLEPPFRKGDLTTDVELYAIWAMNLYAQKKYAEAFDMYKTFFEFFEKVESGKVNTPDSNIAVRTVSTEDKYLTHANDFIVSAVEIGRFEDAYDFINTGRVFRCLKLYSCTENFIVRVLNVFYHFEFKDLNNYLKKADDKSRSLFVKKLEQMLFYSDKKEKIIGALKKVPECAEKAALYELYFGGKELRLAAVNKYIKGRPINDEPGIFMIALEKGLDISDLLAPDICDAEKLAKDGYKNYYGFNKAVDNYDTDLIKDPERLIPAAKFYEQCMYNTVGFSSPKPKVFVIINANRLIENYGRIGSRIEKELSGTQDMDINAAETVGRALELRQKKAYKECIAELKNASEMYPPLSKFIGTYCDDVIYEYESEMKNISRKNSEMQMLAESIKKNIRSCISSGNIQAAQKTLAEYCSIVPDDPEIDILRQEINDKI